MAPTARRSVRATARAPSPPTAVASSRKAAAASSPPTRARSASSSCKKAASASSSTSEEEELDPLANKENVEPEEEEDDDDETDASEGSTGSSQKRKRARPSVEGASSKRTKLVRTESVSSEDASPAPHASTSDVPSTPTKLPPAPTVFAQARSLLRCSSAFLSSSSNRLVGRIAEREALLSFLTTSGKNEKGDSRSRTLYVGGQPGTGKTALITSVLGELDQANEGWRVGIVNCVGMKADAWQMLGNALDLGPGIKTKAELQAALKASRESKFVLALDELDAIISLTAATSSATAASLLLLESIFLLPLSSPNLRIVAIANSLDFPSRFLSHLEAQPTLLPFTAYDNEALSAIVRARLRSLLPELTEEAAQMDSRPTPLIDDKAIEFAARKVQAENGDLRMCLDVCRLSIETVEAELRKKALAKQQQPPAAVSTASSASSETLLSAGPASSPTAGFDAFTAPRAGMTHILKALAAIKAAAASSQSAASFSRPVSSAFTSSSASPAAAGPSKARTPSSLTIQKIKALNIQSRMVLVALLVHSRRASWGLPSLGLRPSASGSSSASSSSSASARLAHLTTTSTLQSTYAHLLTSKDSPLRPVSPSDFHTVLANLADATLVRLTLLSPSKRRPAASAAAQDKRVDLACMEDEVVKGLVGGRGAEEEEARRILEREMDRIDRAREARKREAAREQACPMEERL